jgi:hypothetical protein
MKKIVFIVIITLTVAALNCFGQKKKDPGTKESIVFKSDSLEYSLIVMDPGFDFWLLTQHPANFYSKEYYEAKNRMDVIVWNQRYLSSGGNDLYDTYIDYNSGTDYGLDLNYRLYYYFRFFEKQNRVMLSPKPV